MHSRGVRGTWGRLLVALLLVVLAACGQAQATPPPTPRPTPVITPDPHLPDPTTADDVFLALATAGLRVTANNAASGQGDLVKRINATYLGWPLVVSQYTSSDALATATSWDSGDVPGQEEAPVQIAGLNILVEWGPTTGARPKAPTGPQLDGLRDLAGTLEVLLAPLRARSVVPVPGAATPDPTSRPSEAGDDGEGGDAERTPGS